MTLRQRKTASSQSAEHIGPDEPPRSRARFVHVTQEGSEPSEVLQASLLTEVASGIIRAPASAPPTHHIHTKRPQRKSARRSTQRTETGDVASLDATRVSSGTSTPAQTGLRFTLPARPSPDATPPSRESSTAVSDASEDTAVDVVEPRGKKRSADEFEQDTVKVEVGGEPEAGEEPKATRPKRIRRQTAKSKEYDTVARKSVKRCKTN